MEEVEIIKISESIIPPLPRKRSKEGKIQPEKSINSELTYEPSEYILHLPKIQYEIKRFICRQGLKYGLEYISKKYKIDNLDIIKQWSYLTSVKLTFCATDNIDINRDIENKGKQEKNGLIMENEDIRVNNIEKKVINSREQEFLKAEEEYDEHRSKIKKKTEELYNNLSLAEKERILYDYFAHGRSYTTRKWGLDTKSFYSLIQAKPIRALKQKSKWIKRQKHTIREKINDIRELGLKKLKEKVDIELNESRINVSDLCILSFERGLAFAAVAHKIDLFELEFLIKQLYPEKWAEMERNNWFLVSHEEVKGNSLTSQVKGEIAWIP